MSFHFCIVRIAPCTEPGLRLAPNEQYLPIFIHSNPGLEHLRSSAPEPFSDLFLHFIPGPLPCFWISASFMPTSPQGPLTTSLRSQYRFPTLLVP